MIKRNYIKMLLAHQGIEHCSPVSYSSTHPQPPPDFSRLINLNHTHTDFLQKRVLYGFVTLFKPCMETGRFSLSELSKTVIESFDTVRWVCFSLQRWWSPDHRAAEPQCEEHQLVIVCFYNLCYTEAAAQCFLPELSVLLLFTNDGYFNV